MALASATLSTEIQSVGFPASSAAAIIVWADAYDTYVQESTVNGVAMVAPAAAVAAMKSAMGALAATDFAAALQAGCIAYWTAVIAVPAVWPPSILPSVAPPGLGGIAALIQAAGEANIAAENSLEDSSDAIAAAWHPTTLGGTTTLLVATVPTVFPIL